MKRSGQGSIVILAIMSVAILFVTIIGATFAYFSVNLQKTGTEKKVDVRSKTLVIEFASANNIYYNHAIPGRPKWIEDKKPTNILTFTLTSPTDMVARNQYDIYLNIERNDFITDNLVYYIKENECFRKDGSGSTPGTLYADKITLYKEYENPEAKPLVVLEEFEVGTIPGGYKGKLKISDGAILGGLGCVDEWEVEIWLNELGVEQNEDQGRELRASIEIETGTIYPIKFEDDDNDDDHDDDYDDDDEKRPGKENDNDNVIEPTTSVVQ